ncbi:MAG: Mrp/NBP35 family ATP-binding protein [Prolixibacteraceae bacterium]|jgi:ATP-binding protein involved in chromosome partitioning|nr:Mrp/NBP35 family ATP-binding protein [Prolixibacteraceae bacterium]
MAVQPKDINDALKHVNMPGTQENIVALDMVQEIRIEGKKVSFTLIFQKSNDPNVPIVKSLCVQAIWKHIGRDTEIAGNISTRSVHDMQRPILPGVKNIIAIASGKGGVGKSTVAVNLAVAIAKTGASVGLIDADIYGPSVPIMFGEEFTKPMGEKVGKRDMILPVEKYGVKLLSIGFFVNPEEALVWRGPMASNALKQLIVDAKWGALDYLLIDLPPGTSDIHLTLMQTVPVTGAIIVTTPQDVALADVIKGVNMFKGKSIDVPVLGLIENMAWFTPEELPENKYYIFGKDGGKKMAERLDVPFMGQIPIVQSIREGSDNGKPAATDSDSITGKAFNEIALKTIEAVTERNENVAPSEKINITRK